MADRGWYRRRRAAATRAARRRRRFTGLDFDGPYYPHISSGLLVLESTDTGLRFGVTNGLWTVESGGSGSYVAYVPRVKRGTYYPGQWVLGEL